MKNSRELHKTPFDKKGSLKMQYPHKGKGENAAGDEENALEVKKAQTLEKKWEIITQRFLRKYPILQPDDLDYRIQGFDVMFQNLTLKTGISKNQLRDEIINWEKGPIIKWPNRPSRPKKK